MRKYANRGWQFFLNLIALLSSYYSHWRRKKMLESRGDNWNARSAGIPNDKSKPLGGYQANVIVEPHSASIIPWHMHPIVSTYNFYEN